MNMKTGDNLNVKIEFFFKCKRCNKEYRIYDKSIQPDIDHIDKFIEFHLNRINQYPLNYCHICECIPDSTKKYGKVSSLNNIKSAACINYGIGDLQGFNVDFYKYEDKLGEG